MQTVCTYCDCMIIPNNWYSISSGYINIYFCGTVCMRKWGQTMNYITKYIKTKRAVDQTNYINTLYSSRADVPLFHFL